MAKDERHNRSVAEQVAYYPKAILCVPIRGDESVLGALELLDKSEASFPRAKLLAHCIAGEEQILTALWEGYAMERVIRG